MLTRGHHSVIQGVIDALSEYRTHTMLSNGTHGGGYFTHATMGTPGTSNSIPHLDPGALRTGNPGASQITSAATYVSLYDPVNGGVDFISKQTGGAEGVAVAEFFWSTMGFRWVAKRCGVTTPPGGCTWVATPCNYRTCTGSEGYWQAAPYYDCYGTLRTDNTCSANNRAGQPVPGLVSSALGGGYYRLQEGGQDIPYSLHQFADIANTAAGSIFSGAEGAVCSTLQAYGVNKALGRTLVAPVYDHATTANALVQFGNGVFDACKNSDFGFFGGIIDWFSFGAISDSKCNDTRHQVTNCLINPAWCGDSNGDWKSYANNPAVQARSISPDQISGWRPGEDYNDATSNGPWAPSNFDPVSFSGGGSVYTCWGNG